MIIFYVELDAIVQVQQLTKIVVVLNVSHRLPYKNKEVCIFLRTNIVTKYELVR